MRLKIHFLEEALRKAGPSYNQEALKENSELKSTSITMQRDLQRCRKSLQQAERDLEAYRAQLEDFQEQARSGEGDEDMRQELDAMKEEVMTKEAQVKDLQDELDSAKGNEKEELERLRDEIGDLEATVRERDRIIEDKEEEIDGLKEDGGKDSEAVTELEAELDRVQEQLGELQESLDQAKTESQEANEARQQAIDEKEAAEEDLRELQDEMSNKSFYTKGLSRQLEDKSTKLEEDLTNLRKEYTTLEEEFEDKARRERRLEEQLQELQQDIFSEKDRLEGDIELARHERDIAKRERDEISSQFQQSIEDAQRDGEEKRLLQGRHNALTNESGGLQQELATAQSSIRELQQSLDDEKHRARDNSHMLRSQHKEEVERLTEEIESLQREIDDKESQHALEQDKWQSAQRSLESQKDRAEKQAAGFKQTVERLQEVELTMTGRGMKIQETIDSEKKRHEEQEAVLTRQVKELNEDIASRRKTIEDQRGEISSFREELRVSKREETTLKGKIQELEDEVVVLQASLEEEQEFAQGQLKHGTSSLDTQLQKVTSEKQTLRDQLASANIELHNLRISAAETSAERDELQSQLNQFQNQVDDTYRLDKEKVTLRKEKLRLESEVNRLSTEKRSLFEAKDALQAELDSEVERSAVEENQLHAEIDQLSGKLTAASEGRDKELTASKNRVQRLETRVGELTTLVEQQWSAEPEDAALAADLSTIRNNLNEARQKEKASLEREASLKTSIRNIKSRNADLEREIHELQVTRIAGTSPRSSPSAKAQEEIHNLRRQVSDAYKSLKESRKKNQELERAAVAEDERKDLHELLKSSALEAESLSVRLSERDAHVNELRSQLRRVRQERAASIKKADAMDREVEALQTRYETAVDDLALRTDRKGKHDKEIRGLSKEILWLRARLNREEKFRRDLAWSKGLMELGERVRAAWYVLRIFTSSLSSSMGFSLGIFTPIYGMELTPPCSNETDLKMIANMGVKPPATKKKAPDLRRKLRAAAITVIASVRMRKLSQEWNKVRKVGDSLKKAKVETLRKRDSTRKKRIEQS